MLSFLLSVLLIAPATTAPAEPTWGLDNGIRVGLWPADGGPRGLIRIYAPYLENPAGQVINFIAVEPIVGGKRSYSELERSAADGRPGKQMWAVDELPRDWAAWQPPRMPARGREVEIDGARALTFFVVVEPLDNGARPVLQVILRRDRPHEVTLRVDAAPGTAPMDACVLSATMGNYARLRRLHLKDAVVEAAQLWPKFETLEPYGAGFTAPAQWGAAHLPAHDGVVQVAATPDEPDPGSARYEPATPAWWRYCGQRAAQYWRTPATKDLVVRVNGRRAYWGGRIAIPGGVAFENFEMQAPFVPGQWFSFGVRELPAP
jgi:hypothetical protein